MADNPLKYSDFIQPDDSILNLIAQLEKAGATYEAQIKKIKDTAATMEASIRKNTSATAEGQEAIRATSAEVDKLAKAEEKLRESWTNNGVELKKLQSIQGEQNRLTKLELQLQQSKEGSYNKLSAQYSLLKIKLNQMSEAERKATKTGQMMEKQARDTYEQMKRLQEATGKHTLSVGDYTKATYGLNTAFNQVTRELPVLGMNLNTFFLAISNNIPMLVDEIDRLRVANKAAIEQGKTTIPLGKQLAKAIFSWQTALSIGVALLTIYGKDMVEWIVKLIRGKEAIDEQAEAQKRLNDVRREGIKQAQDELVKAEILYTAATDVARGYNERLSAVKHLKEEWPEYFKNLGDEEVLTGKAAKTYALLAQSIMATAQARAAQNKIVENYERIYDIQKEIGNLREEIVKKTGDDPWGVGFFGAKGVKETKEMRALEAERKELLEDIQSLVKTIDIEALFTGSDKGAGAASKDETIKLLRAWTDALYELEADQVKRDMKQTKAKYDRQIEDLKLKLVTDQNLTAQGREAINGTIVALEKQLQQELLKIAAKGANDRQKEADQEAKYQEEQAQARYDRAVESYDIEYDLEVSKIDIMKTTEAEKTRLRLQAEADRIQKIIDLNLTGEQYLSDMQVEILKNTIKRLKQEIDSVEGEDLDVYSLFGLDLDKDEQRAIEESFKYASKYMNEYMDKVVDQARRRVDLADEQVDATQKILDAEIQARNNGYAYNVTTAQKELALARQTQQKALREQEKAQRAQLAIDTVAQASNLITASSKILKVGIPWAIPLLAIMWGAFAASKVKAFQVSKQSYGEGGLEILEGGSHASGHDIFLGHTGGGKQRRAEGGEAMAIIRRDKTRKYRKLLPGVVDALNKGVFEEKYMGIYNMNTAGGMTDVRAIEQDVGAIKRQGERRYFVDGRGRTVEKYKNLIRIYHAN